MLHAVVTHLRINLQEAWSGFGLFGRHSYMTVLVMKILNVSGIRNGQNPILLGNAVQRSHMGLPGDSGRIARESTERLEWSVELCRS